LVNFRFIYRHHNHIDLLYYIRKIIMLYNTLIIQINCEDDNDKFLNNAQFKSNESSKVKLRKKREFSAWFQIPVPIIEFVYEDDGKNGTEDADVTTTVKSGMTATAANVGAAYKNFLDAFQSSKETHIVTIGSDVNNSLVEAAPYLPLVNKLTTYIMPELSLSDVVTLSLNVAVLATQGAADNANAQVNGDQVRVYLIILCINVHRLYMKSSNFQTFLHNAPSPFLDFQKPVVNEFFWLH